MLCHVVVVRNWMDLVIRIVLVEQFYKTLRKLQNVLCLGHETSPPLIDVIRRNLDENHLIRERL